MTLSYYNVVLFNGRYMKRNEQQGIREYYRTFAILPVEILVIIIAFFISMIVFSYITWDIFMQKDVRFDGRVFNLLSPYVSDTNTKIMEFFTFFGSPIFLIIANLCLVGYYLFIKKNRWYSIRILAFAISSLLLLFWFKFFFNRPRPLVPLLKEVPGLSFPSGHAFMSFTFFGLMIYIVFKEIRNNLLKTLLIIGIFLLVVMIGLSRIYLRVHYASDVIAGYSLGMLSLVISIVVLEGFKKFAVRKFSRFKEMKIKTVK